MQNERVYTRNFHLAAVSLTLEEIDMAVPQLSRGGSKQARAPTFPSLREQVCG
jgi:hypothetical protein